VARKATSTFFALTQGYTLTNLAVEAIWGAILNATNVANKIIYLVIVPYVSVARKKDTFKRTALKSPQAAMETTSFLKILDKCPQTAHKRQVCHVLFVIKKAISLINVPNVSVARKKDTFKGTVLRLKPLPLAEMETASILMN